MARKRVDIARDHVNFNEEVQNEHEGNSTYGENNEKWLNSENFIPKIGGV